MSLEFTGEFLKDYNSFFNKADIINDLKNTYKLDKILTASQNEVNEKAFKVFYDFMNSPTMANLQVLDEYFLFHQYGWHVNAGAQYNIEPTSQYYTWHNLLVAATSEGARAKFEKCFSPETYSKLYDASVKVLPLMVPLNRHLEYALFIERCQLINRIVFGKCFINNQEGFNVKEDFDVLLKMICNNGFYNGTEITINDNVVLQEKIFYIILFFHFGFQNRSDDEITQDLQKAEKVYVTKTEAIAEIPHYLFHKISPIFLLPYLIQKRDLTKLKEKILEVKKEYTDTKAKTIYDTDTPADLEYVDGTAQNLHQKIKLKYDKLEKIALKKYFYDIFQIRKDSADDRSGKGANILEMYKVCDIDYSKWNPARTMLPAYEDEQYNQMLQSLGITNASKAKILTISSLLFLETYIKKAFYNFIRERIFKARKFASHEYIDSSVVPHSDNTPDKNLFRIDYGYFSEYFVSDHMYDNMDTYLMKTYFHIENYNSPDNQPYMKFNSMIRLYDPFTKDYLDLDLILPPKEPENPDVIPPTQNKEKLLRVPTYQISKLKALKLLQVPSLIFYDGDEFSDTATNDNKINLMRVLVLIEDPSTMTGTEKLDELIQSNKYVKSLYQMGMSQSG